MGFVPIGLTPHLAALPHQTNLKLRKFLQQLQFCTRTALQTTRFQPSILRENRTMPDQPRDKGKRGRGGPVSRDVQISKAMSLLLRHAAEKEGLKMNDQGYANVSDVVCSFLPESYISFTPRPPAY